MGFMQKVKDWFKDDETGIEVTIVEDKTEHPKVDACCDEKEK